MKILNAKDDIHDSKDFEERNSKYEIDYSEKQFLDMLTKNLLSSEILNAMKNLSEIERKVIDLVFFDGYKKVDARKILNLNSGEFTKIYSTTIEKMKGLL